MRRLFLLLAALGFGIGPAGTSPAAGPARLEFKPGDLVVMIGDDLIERDQKFGYLETILTVQNPDKGLTFRNLGWSGDTVFGDARAGFGTRADGFRHLKEHVLALKPHTILVGYGMSESFDGPAGLPAFEKGLKVLLDVLAETRARVVILSPVRHADLGRPLPDPAAHNQSLELYRDALFRAARSSGLPTVDLFSKEPGHAARRFTEDGIHLNENGYMFYGSAIAAELFGTTGTAARLAVGRDGSGEGEGTTLSKVERTPRGVRFEATRATLPWPAPAGKDVLAIDGLEPGRYTLKIDGKVIAMAGAEAWKEMTLQSGPDFDQVEALRKAIKEKNVLYFHRWRPQNETYLFGFRKHEQGNNAREIPQFDPLVEAKEKEIARLRVPVPHVYELIRERVPDR